MFCVVFLNTKTKSHVPFHWLVTMRWWVQVPGDAAGVPAGLHGPSQAAAGPERALQQSAHRLWEEMGHRQLPRLACEFSRLPSLLTSVLFSPADLTLFLSFLCVQKETSSALTHAGAHLDLSAFSSWEVKHHLVYGEVFILWGNTEIKMHKSRKVGKLKSPGIKMSTLELISYNKHKVTDKREKKVLYCPKNQF